MLDDGSVGVLIAVAKDSCKVLTNKVSRPGTCWLQKVHCNKMSSFKTLTNIHKSGKLCCTLHPAITVLSDSKQKAAGTLVLPSQLHARIIPVPFRPREALEGDDWHISVSSLRYQNCRSWRQGIRLQSLRAGMCDVMMSCLAAEHARGAAGARVQIAGDQAPRRQLPPHQHRGEPLLPRF